MIPAMFLIFSLVFYCIKDYHFYKTPFCTHFCTRFYDFLWKNTQEARLVFACSYEMLLQRLIVLANSIFS